MRSPRCARRGRGDRPERRSCRGARLEGGDGRVGVGDCHAEAGASSAGDEREESAPGARLAEDTPPDLVLAEESPAGFLLAEASAELALPGDPSPDPAPAGEAAAAPYKPFARM